MYKVFRQGTRFKKWRLGLTITVVRKQYVRRKHLTNNLIFSSVIHEWVSIYLKSRKFTTFYQGLRLLPLSFTSSFNEALHTSLLNNSEVFKDYGFLVYKNSFNINYLKHILFFNENKIFLDVQSFYKNSYQTGLFIEPAALNDDNFKYLDDLTLFINNQPLYISKVFSGDSFYESNILSSLNNKRLINFDGILVSNSLMFVKSIYLILILSSLYNIKRY